jgi:hypothetical protein
MPQQNNPANFVLATDPMLANIGEVTEDKFELVFIHGRIGKLTDDTVCLHQGLDLRHRYEIPRREIVFVKIITCSEGDLTEIILFSTTVIKYVSGPSTATMPAAALAASVSASNGKVQQPAPALPCRPGCGCNGKCLCASVDHWFKLDADTAKKLGVVVSNPPSGTTK